VLTVFDASLSTRCRSPFRTPTVGHQQCLYSRRQPDARWPLRQFSNDLEDYRLPGFQLGGEPGPGAESFNLGASELNISANIDNSFGYLTTPIATENGET